MTDILWATSLAPGIANMDRGLSSDMYMAYAESKTMIDPLSFANFTSRVSCSLVAAEPVGLFGEQKNMISVRVTLDKSGKKPFSGVHLMYSILPYFSKSF